jgi:hypothetical protein
MSKFTSQPSYQEWLVDTYVERYKMISFRTLTFTAMLFSSLIPLKLFLRNFQDYLPNILAGFLPTFTSTHSIVDISVDILFIIFIVLIIQLILHSLGLVAANSHFAQTTALASSQSKLSSKPTTAIQSNIYDVLSLYPTFQFCEQFGLVSFLGISRKKTSSIQKIRFAMFIIFLVGIAFMLLCHIFEISTTTTPSTELFSYHQATALSTNSILFLFTMLKPAQPVFWARGISYTIDCLSTQPIISTPQPQSNNHRNSLSSFSTNLPLHSYSLYNPSYYPSLNDLMMSSSRHINTSDAINSFVGNNFYSDYRQYVSEFRRGAFSERYDVDVQISSPVLSTSSSTTNNSENINAVKPDNRPLIPLISLASKIDTHSIPMSVPTHASARPLTPSIISKSVPILSLHQYHKAQSTLSELDRNSLKTTEQQIYTNYIHNPYPFFFIPLLICATLYSYLLFSIVGIPHSTFVLFNLIGLLMFGFALSTTIAYYITFPSLKLVNLLMSMMFGQSNASQFGALFHYSSSSKLLAAITLPTAVFSQLMGKDSQNSQPQLFHDALCPDSYSLAFVPYTFESIFTFSTLIGFFIALALILVPFCYHLYCIKVVISTPLNYSKYILQALACSTNTIPASNINTNNVIISNFLAPYTIPHTLQFLSNLANKDSLFLALNNSALAPLLANDSDAITTNTPNTTISNNIIGDNPNSATASIHPNKIPYYTQFYMEYLIEHCINSTTKQIYNVLLDMKITLRSDPNAKVKNAKIEAILEILSKSSPQFNPIPSPQISPFLSPISFLLSAIDNFLFSSPPNDPTVVLDLLQKTLLLPTNVAVISGNVTPLVDQSSQFVYSQHSLHVLNSFIAKSIISLLELQLALEDLILFISSRQFPNPSTSRSFTPCHLKELGIEPTSTNPQAFRYLVFRQYNTLSPASQNQLTSIYSHTVETLHNLINHHFPRQKVNFNISLPHSLVHSFNTYLEQRPS